MSAAGDSHPAQGHYFQLSTNFGVVAPFLGGFLLSRCLYGPVERDAARLRYFFGRLIW